MKRRFSTDSGSLDMLLDTMCNTFGGVCFIALMVAIISASIPASSDDRIKEMGVSEQMIINKETARLTRQRDELKSAIATQRAFVTASMSNEAQSMSAAQLSSGISSNATALAKLKDEKIELEDKLAKLATDISYNAREALRLARLLKELEERVDNPINTKNRVVRTPVERELEGYRSVDVWIRNGRMYCLGNERHVDYKITDGENGKSWSFRIKPSGGYLLHAEFFHSSEYRQLIEMINGRVFVRIFCDSSSFTQLCELRDDLIRHRKMYNWHFCEDQVLRFVEGYDGRVQ